MLRSPLLLTLDLTRVEHAEDPYAFRFVPQDYLARTEGGAISRIHLEWDQTWLDDLERLRRASPSASTLQRVGERLSRFLDGAGWAAQAAAIDGVLRAGRGVILTLRSTAAELYTLPWELLILGSSGQHLGELDGVVIRYEWPETSTVPELAAPRSERGRVLLAWSAAGGAVPAVEHIDVLSEACEAGHRPFDRERDVLSHASLGALEEQLERALQEGPPIDVLHLLAHAKGGLEGGIVLDGSDGTSSRVGPEKLRQLLRRYAGMIRLVVFSACESADPGAVANALGGLTQALHRAGIAAVIGSRFPLSVDASIRFSRAIYGGLIVSLRSLEESVALGRTELRQRSDGIAWATIQLYARTADGAESRPLVVRPYRGLLSFGPENRRLFFGRGQEVQELRRDLDALVEQGRPRLMIVAGASGSGKSSVVLAGLVPSLLQESDRAWAWIQMRPGPSPLQSLARAVSHLRGGAVEAEPGSIAEALFGWREDHSARPLLVVVDQLEELFTQGAQAPEREAFARLLWRLAGDPTWPVTIVSTLRVDFIGACGQLILDDQGLRLDRIAYDERHRIFVARADLRLLREVIVAPARAVGLTHEPGLVERLIDDIDGDAGALPALSHALDLLWRRRRGNTLTQGGYDAIGGVTGALALHAEAIIDEFNSAELRVAQHLLVRLVSDGGERRLQDTRARLPLDRLRPAGAEAEAAAFDRVVERLTERRLLVLSEGDRPQRSGRRREVVLVEVAHDALLRAWPRLQRWVDEDLDRITQRRRLRAWVADHQERAVLLDATRLTAAQEFATEHPEDVDPSMRALIDSSLAAHHEAAAVETRRRAVLERSLARTRKAALLTGLLAVVALILTGVSERAYSALQRESQLRLDAPLYTLLGRIPAEDPRTILDVLAEIAIADDPRWIAAADRALGQLPEQRLLTVDPTLRDFAVSSTGLVAIRSADVDGLEVLRAADPQGSRIALELGAVEDMAWDVEGRLLVLRSDGLLSVLQFNTDGWLVDERPLRTIELGGPTSLSLSREPGGRLIALNEPEDHRARIIDSDPESESIVVIDGGDAPFTAIRLIDRGRSLLTASGDLAVADVADSDLRIWDTRSGSLRSSFPLRGDLAIAVTMDRDREQVRALTRTGELLAWDRVSPGIAPSRDAAGHGPLLAAAFSPGSGDLALLSTIAGELVIQPLPAGPPIQLRGPGDRSSTAVAWREHGRVFADDGGDLRSYRADGRYHSPREMDAQALRARVYELATCMPFAEMGALAGRYGIDGIAPRSLCVNARKARVSELLREGELLLIVFLPLLLLLELAIVATVRRRRMSSGEGTPSGGREAPPALGLVTVAIIVVLATGLAFSAINVLPGDDGIHVITIVLVATWLLVLFGRLSPRRLHLQGTLSRTLLSIARASLIALALALATILAAVIDDVGARPAETGDNAAALFTFGFLLLLLVATFVFGLQQTSLWLRAPAAEGSS